MLGNSASSRTSAKPAWTACMVRASAHVAFHSPCVMCSGHFHAYCKHTCTLSPPFYALHCANLSYGTAAIIAIWLQLHEYSTTNQKTCEMTEEGSGKGASPSQRLKAPRGHALMCPRSLCSCGHLPDKRRHLSLQRPPLCCWIKHQMMHEYLGTVGQCLRCTPGSCTME
jgi:hypothetical protein